MFKPIANLLSRLPRTLCIILMISLAIQLGVRTVPPEALADSGSSSGERSDGIKFAMQFENRRDVIGTMESYSSHPSGLPKPEYFMKYGSVYVWDRNLEEQRDFLGIQAQRAARVGIRKILYTPTALYGKELDSRFRAGTIPPLDELVRRKWKNQNEPGFLDALVARRDTLKKLVESGTIQSIILRPFQEAGSGIHDNTGLTPERYKSLIEWMVNDLYKDLPVEAVIVHWNQTDGLAEALPELDGPGIKIYAGVTISMPAVGGMASIDLIERNPERVLRAIRKKRPDISRVDLENGLDFASRAWDEAGVKTWIAEFSVFDDGRVDPVTGWKASGLTEPSVIPEFFHHYRKMRETGHIAGITWLNKIGFTGKNKYDPDLKDGRWDGPHVHPNVRQWWIDEVTRANGYDIDAGNQRACRCVTVRRRGLGQGV